MYTSLMRLATTLSAAAVLVAAWPTAYAQDAPEAAANDTKQAAPASPDQAAPTPGDALTHRQSQIADKYARLEQLMRKMAEFEHGSNPRRAELLKKVVAQGQQRQIQLQMETLIKLLTDEKYSRAVSNQGDVSKDLDALLQLLLTENSADRLKSEQARIREYLKEVERIIRHHRSVQGRTEGGDDTDRLADEQGKVADKTGDLQKKIADNESAGQPNGQDGEPKDGEPKDGEPKDGEPKEGEPKDGEPKDGEPSEGQPSEGQPSEGQPSEGQPSEGQPSEGQPSEGQPSEGQPSEGQPSEGQPSEGQPSEGQQDQQDQTPARKRLEEAERRMREAQKRLEEAQRDEAVDEQEKARQELEKAKAELEEILRQLREEEIERVLAMLEGRFRMMLEAQLKVYESTKRLDEIPADRRTREVDIQAGKLSFDERKILIEADRALLLLREEGSSVAFPEVVEQMQQDMQQVVDRLARTKIGTITQGIEEDIIAALEEMIEALQKAQEEQDQRQQQQQQMQQGPPGAQPLIDAIAELKMIRAMQMRVNNRTQRYSKLLDDVDDPAGQATHEDLLESIRKLSEREQRIQGITRDVDLGKNK